MKEICITDHHDYDENPEDSSFLLDIPAYLRAMKRLQKEYEERIRVNIGVELGLQIHTKDYLERLVPSLDVDYLIGSSHYIDRMDPYFPEYFAGRSEREAYERYFESTLERVKGMECFDSFGHLDYVVRYGPNTNQYYTFRDYQDYIDPILKVLIEKGKALECNTAGFRYGLGHPNPTEDILCRYYELGGELLTVGSDAHSPEYLGYAFSGLPDLLKACGFRYYTVYRRRVPNQLCL